MKGIELLKRLREINKPFYTTADLEKITGLERSSLYVALERWVSGGIIERAAQGIYVPTGGVVSTETVASQIYIPNYLSFESALSQHGVLNLVPHALTFATTRKTRSYVIQKRVVEFKQIDRRLFFGYEMRNGVNIATPEKAFLDQMYFVSRGKASLDTAELNIRKLSKKTLKAYSNRFPNYVTERMKRVIGE
jgi:predicted transcriptional regulator of viral defense system